MCAARRGAGGGPGAGPGGPAAGARRSASARPNFGLALPAPQKMGKVEYIITYLSHDSTALPGCRGRNENASEVQIRETKQRTSRIIRRLRNPCRSRICSGCVRRVYLPKSGEMGPPVCGDADVFVASLSVFPIF